MRAQRDGTSRPMAIARRCLHALNARYKEARLHFTHIHINDNVSARQSICLSFFTPPRVCAAVHTYTQVRTSKDAADMHTYAHAYTHTWTAKTPHVAIPLRTYKHTCTFARTHTQQTFTHR